MKPTDTVCRTALSLPFAMRRLLTIGAVAVLLCAVLATTVHASESSVESPDSISESDSSLAPPPPPPVPESSESSSSNASSASSSHFSSSFEDPDCNASIPFYSAVQIIHTARFLSLFKSAIPALGDAPACTNFCTWSFVSCISATRLAVIIPEGVSGTLPRIPITVNSAYVRVTSIVIQNSPELTGALPLSWAYLTSLTSVTISKTGISSTLPATWGNMWNLRKLSITENTNIFGELPSEWSALRNLQALSLSLNSYKLGGSLPASWSQITTLATMDLSYNNFTGPVPAAWGEMQRLGFVRLTGNNLLCGCLPTPWMDGSAAVLVYASSALTSSTCATSNRCLA